MHYQFELKPKFQIPNFELLLFSMLKTMSYKTKAQDEEYLSADSVWCPERHGERLAVAADVVAVVQDGVLGTEEHSRSAVRQVPAVWESKEGRDETHGARTCNLWIIRRMGSGRRFTRDTVRNTQYFNNLNRFTSTKRQFLGLTIHSLPQSLV